VQESKKKKGVKSHGGMVESLLVLDYPVIATTGFVLIYIQKDGLNIR